MFGQFDLPLGNLESWIRAEWMYRSSITSDIEAVVSLLEPLDNELTQQLVGGGRFKRRGLDARQIDRLGHAPFYPPRAGGARFYFFSAGLSLAALGAAPPPLSRL